MKEAFLSYHHEDKVLARSVKDELERMGFAGFLAHEDIEVSAEWRTEIRKHLDSCSGLIAIVTNSFGKSPWTNQEVGIVIGKGKPVIPLIFGPSSLLPGLLEAIQGIPSPESDLASAVSEAVRVITDKGRPLEKTKVYDEVVPILTEFVNRWESYLRLPENERWISSAYGGAHDAMQVAAHRIANKLIAVYSANSDLIDPGILNQLKVISDQMEAFSRSRILSVGSGDYEEMERKGKTAYGTAVALLAYLKQTLEQ